MLWRPSAFLSKPFNAINSELKHPIENEWNRDSLVITNADDIFREISYLVKDLVVDTRVFDGRVSGLIETKSNKKLTRIPLMKKVIKVLFLYNIIKLQKCMMSLLY